MIKGKDEDREINWEKDLLPLIRKRGHDEGFTMGIEVEMFLVNRENDLLLRDEDILREILEQVPYEIHRDYYPYQLEIRTKGTERTAKEVFDSYSKLKKLVDKVAYDYGYLIYPRGDFPLSFDSATCGIHMHFRFDNEQLYFRRAWAIYPYVLLLAHIYSNSSSFPYRSARLRRCRHIGTISNRGNDFKMSVHPYTDIRANTTKSGTRRRMKKVNTMEIRIFDTVDNENLSNILQDVWNVVNYVPPLPTKYISQSGRINPFLVNKAWQLRKTIVNSSATLPLYLPLFNLHTSDVCSNIHNKISSCDIRDNWVFSSTFYSICSNGDYEMSRTSMIHPEDEYFLFKRKEVERLKQEFDFGWKRLINLGTINEGKLEKEASKKKLSIYRVFDVARHARMYGKDGTQISSCNCVDCLKERMGILKFLQEKKIIEWKDFVRGRKTYGNGAREREAEMAERERVMRRRNGEPTPSRFVINYGHSDEEETVVVDDAPETPPPNPEPIAWTTHTTDEISRNMYESFFRTRRNSDAEEEE